MKAFKKSRLTQKKFAKRIKVATTTFNHWVKDYKSGKYDLVQQPDKKKNRSSDYPKVDAGLIEFIQNKRANNYVGKISLNELWDHIPTILENINNELQQKYQNHRAEFVQKKNERRHPGSGYNRCNYTSRGTTSLGRN